MHKIYLGKTQTREKTQQQLSLEEFLSKKYNDQTLVH